MAAVAAAERTRQPPACLRPSRSPPTPCHTHTPTQQIRADEQRGIPHHLIDVLDPEAEFSAGDFFTLARAAAEDILQVGFVGRVRPHCCCWMLLTRRLHVADQLMLTAATHATQAASETAGDRRARFPLQRGRTPIVVGGTGFYLRWFIHGKPATPSATPASEAAARERLEQVGAWGGAAGVLGSHSCVAS